MKGNILAQCPLDDVQVTVGYYRIESKWNFYKMIDILLYSITNSDIYIVVSTVEIDQMEYPQQISIDKPIKNFILN